MDLHSYLLLWLLIAGLAAAKFDALMSQTSRDGLQACLASGTYNETSSIYSVAGCGEGFRCIMANIDNSGQTILSTGSAILGFVGCDCCPCPCVADQCQIPTALVLIGSSNEEIVRLHARFPLLAFWMSMNNANKAQQRITWSKQDAQKPPLQPINLAVNVEPYGLVKRPTLDRTSQRVLKLVHALAAACAASLVYETYRVGREGVIAWACWTDFYPGIWLAVAVVQHLACVLCLRLTSSIEVQYNDRWTLRAIEHSRASSTRTAYIWQCCLRLLDLGLRIWHRLPVADLTHQRVEIFNSRPTLAHWLKVLTDMIGLANYVFGTIVFSSLTLISGHDAIIIVLHYGFVAMASRVMATWALDLIEIT